MKKRLGLLLQVLISPRRGLQRLLDPDEQSDHVALPLFATLLGYFFAAMLYALILRQAGAADGAAPVSPRATLGLTAAVPFITSLTVVIDLLWVGLVILIVARFVLGSRRPYGDWVGLAALSSMPGIVRLLILCLAVAAGLVPVVQPEEGLGVIAMEPAWSLYHLLGSPAHWPPLLAGALVALDPFQIWSLVILGAGFAVYNGRAWLAGGGLALLIWFVRAIGKMGQFG